MSAELKDMPTLSILASVRGACIGHEDAAKDVVKFNRTLIQLINELYARAERDGLNPDDGSMISELRQENRRLEAENISLKRSISAMRRRQPVADEPCSDALYQPNIQPDEPSLKPYDENAIFAMIRGLRARKVAWLKIADALNDQGHRTVRGRLLTQQTANLIYKRNGGDAA